MNLIAESLTCSGCFGDQVLLGLGEGGPLLPSTEYFYVIGEGVGAESASLSFTMPPPTGPESLPYRHALLTQAYVFLFADSVIASVVGGALLNVVLSAVGL